MCYAGGGKSWLVNERILSGKSHRHGYTSYVLRKEGKSYPYHGHVLVMRTFVGMPEAGLVICHNDSNGSNNRLDNLRYDTVKSNSADMIAAGTRMFGERNPSARFSLEEVKAIRERRAAGEQPARIARDYGVDSSTIGTIAKGKTWAWAGGPLTQPSPKITQAAVVELRTRRANGERIAALAAEYGISQTYTQKICFGYLQVNAGGPLTKPSTMWRKNRVQETA